MADDATTTNPLETAQAGPAGDPPQGAPAGDTGATAAAPPDLAAEFARGVQEAGGKVEGATGAPAADGGTGSSAGPGPTAGAGPTGASGPTAAVGGTGPTGASGGTGGTGPTGATGPDEAVEREIRDMRLQPDSAASKRFRELSTQNRELREQVEPLRQQAARAEAWEQEIGRTGANVEQLQGALGYLAAVNSGDPALMNKGFDAMLAELKWLGQRLGRSVDGVVNPLEQHPDIAQALAQGRIDQAQAQEVVRLRAQNTMQQQSLQQRQEREQAQVQQQRTYQDAMAQVNALESELRALDPHFEAKKEQLYAALPGIKALPPDQWAPTIRRFYLTIKAPAVVATPAPQTPPVGSMPLRPTGSAAGTVRQPKDMKPEEAFAYGVSTLR